MTKKIFFLFTLMLALSINFSLTASVERQKIVLITGASQGLGLAMAKKLVQEGYVVYGTVRETSTMSSMQEVIDASQGNFRPITLNVTDEISIQKAVTAILQEAGKIDVLINNAAKVVIGPCEVCTIEEHKDVMEVNYFGVIRMLQAVLPSMRRARLGHIINISSIAGFDARPLIDSYVASKFALEGLTASLAVYLNRWNIKVSIIEPAGIQTNIAWNASMGSRQDEAAYFSEFCEAGHQSMKQSFEVAQDPTEIAELIARVIKEDRPQLRYQTNTISRDLAEGYYKDPAGTASVLAKRKAQEKLLQILR